MDRSPEAPLMAHQEDRLDEDDLHYAELSAPAAHEQTPAHRPTAFVWLLTLAAAVSGLLFGYDTGVISATLVSLGQSLSNRELTSLDKSIITSATALLALAASPLASILADARGRKGVILVADALFLAGALVQAFSSTVSWMVVGRAIVGAGVGAASFVTPLYIAELAPAASRGTLMTMNVVSVTLGQVVAYIVGWVLAEHSDPAVGWRIMVGLGALPAALQAVMVIFMPETPRWLVKAGATARAREVIEKVNGQDPSSEALVDGILKEIEIEVREEEASRRLNKRLAKGLLSNLGGWHELMTIPRNKRALAIACLLQGLQQLCGFNSLMYFSASIFAMLGFTTPTLTSLSVALTNFVFTVVALVLIDRIGRRRILLYSVPIMIVGLLLSAVGFRFTSNAAPSPGAAVVILFSIILYVAAYALGLGNVPWLQSELFPLSVRSLGSGLATATNWLANFVVGLTFLLMMEALTPTWTFALYAGVCVVGWVLIWSIYPETAGLSLEEAAGLLETGWGAK